MLGHKIIVYTVHKNLTQEALGYTSERVMKWQFLMEEFGQEMKYVQGKANTVADVISRLNYSSASLLSDTTLDLGELFTLDKNEMELFPMSLQ
eukprot:5112091-Ditylum_brightwellii.AAC.1